MTITDDARVNQLGSGRTFIYFRHTRQGIVPFASRELSPQGVSKRQLPITDPAYGPAQIFVRNLINLAKANGYGGRGGKLPTSAAMEPFVMPAAELAGVTAVFLAKTPVYSTRILVTVAKHDPHEGGCDASCAGHFDN